MLKKISTVLLTVAFVLAVVTFPVVGATTENVVVTVNGRPIAEQTYDPIWNELKNRVLVKPQFFADYFDADVSTRDGVTVISKNGHTISFTESEKRFVMDKIGGRNLESANISSDNGVYIPLRFMCESLGAQVEWSAGATKVTTGDFSLPDEASQYLKGVTVFDQSTIRLAGSKVVYIDPYRIAGEPRDADIVLVTHTHPDHLDIESIKKITKDSTVLLIAGEGGVEKAEGVGAANVIGVVPNNEYIADGIKVKTIPAYNTSPERRNHRPEHNFVGYIVELDGVTYYSAGDTDYIDDMNELDVDVAFLPIDGRFNMEETEAARAANAIAPKVAVPYHYSNFSSESNAQDFIALLDEGIIGVLMAFKMYGN